MIETKSEMEAEKQYEETLSQVIQDLAQRFNGAVDYRTDDSETFFILDKDDNIIGSIQEREMTKLWNKYE